MKQNIWNVILGISLAVLLGLTTNYWWPEETAEEEKQEIAPATNEDNNTTTTVGVDVDFSIKLKKEESTTTTPTPQQTTTPFISVCLDWYNNNYLLFQEKEVVNGHIQIEGYDLTFPDSLLLKGNTKEKYCGYILIFFSKEEKKITNVIQVKNSLHLSQEDLSLITDTLIVDNLGNRYQLPIRSNVENVEVIGVLDEYVVSIKQGPSKLPKRLGCLSVVFIVVGVVIYLFMDTESKLGVILVIVGIILAVIGACILL